MQSRPPRACFLAINDRYDDVQVHRYYSMYKVYFIIRLSTRGCNFFFYKYFSITCDDEILLEILKPL